VGTIFAGGLLNQLVATPTDELFVAVVTLIVMGYTLGRHQEGRARWIPLSSAIVAVTAIQAVSNAGDSGFVALVIIAGAAGGALVRSRAKLTRELAERTHELELLRAERERDAVLDERRRIARELHDVVAHTVSVMVVQAGGARRQLGRDPQRALAAMAQVDETGREALTELDRLFGLLQTDDTAAPSRLADVSGLVERTRGAGLPVTLEVSGESFALDPAADLAAFRLVQEALTNTLKHAGDDATAHIALRWSADGVELTVRDTGHGLDGPRGQGSRRGLEGMRDRVAAVGGEVVDAGPHPDGGFVVAARLPAGACAEVRAA
jgi:signal transduction histidine kinase